MQQLKTRPPFHQFFFAEQIPRFIFHKMSARWLGAAARPKWMLARQPSIGKSRKNYT